MKIKINSSIGVASFKIKILLFLIIFVGAIPGCGSTQNKVDPREQDKIPPYKLNDVIKYIETKTKRLSRNLQGALVLTIIVATSGDITSIEIQSNKLSNPEVATSIVSKLNGLLIQNNTGADLVINIPFVFD